MNITIIVKINALTPYIITEERDGEIACLECSMFGGPLQVNKYRGWMMRILPQIKTRLYTGGLLDHLKHPSGTSMAGLSEHKARCSTKTRPQPLSASTGKRLKVINQQSVNSRRKIKEEIHIWSFLNRDMGYHLLPYTTICYHMT